MKYLLSIILNVAVGQIVPSVKLAVGEKCRRSKIPSVKMDEQARKIIGNLKIVLENLFAIEQKKINRKFHVATEIGSTFFG
jgi:hypothetical protein